MHVSRQPLAEIVVCQQLLYNGSITNQYQQCAVKCNKYIQLILLYMFENAIFNINKKNNKIYIINIFKLTVIIKAMPCLSAVVRFSVNVDSTVVVR